MNNLRNEEKKLAGVKKFTAGYFLVMPCRRRLVPDEGEGSNIEVRFVFSRTRYSCMSYKTLLILRLVRGPIEPVVDSYNLV
jgi:hypothetical protein